MAVEPDITVTDSRQEPKHGLKCFLMGGETGIKVFLMLGSHKIKCFLMLGDHGELWH